MAQFFIANGPMQTTAAFATVATGTAIKTMLQVKPSATASMKVLRWGISFDGSAASTPGKVELIETDVAATVTASATADIIKYDGVALNGGDPVTNLIVVGTTSTGYTSSGEGSITAVRNFDIQLLPPTAPYIYEFPMGREPVVQISKFLRIRVTFGTTVNVYCWVLVEI
jgi:hypothetical protein